VHYVFEPGTFVPVAQAVRHAPIDLIGLPDYSGEYSLDEDPVWNHKATALPFDALAWYQCDHLGTPQELTDSQGNLAWTAQYKAWGQVTEQRSEWARQHGVLNPIRFQGQYHDHETGLHYNRHRYYDPGVGRFVSKDPIGYAGGINLYAYAPNPVLWTDPWGLSNEPLGSENNPFVTSRAARREAMRQAGIPTSQQPSGQSKNKSGWEYRYDSPQPGGGNGQSSVQQQTMDVSHPDKPHWEAGKVKLDDNGSPRMSKHGRPQLRNGKGKAFYKQGCCK
jgi:RHS repeat-associated protein